MVQQAYDAYLHVEVNGNTSVSFARSRGIAPPTVTLYRRLGIALARVGVKADSALFDRLAHATHDKQVRCPAALERTVGAAIEAPGATVKSIERAVSLLDQ